MKVYQLTGTSVDGDHDWECCPIYATREAAENQMANEIRAYTTYNGEVLFECPFEFKITEIEVQD